jgi:TatD DNase family protein
LVFRCFMLIDSHCHLTSGRFKGRVQEIVEQARSEGVRAMVSAGADLADSAAAVELAKQHVDVFCSAGVHPHEAKDAPPEYIAQLRQIVATGADKCVAVGEIGLDYHYEYSPRQVQQRVFVEQLQLAGELGKPAIVHTREAAADTLAILAPFAGKLSAVIHSFTGDGDEVRRFLDQGWLIGFAGIVTYKNAGLNREAARLVPADRILAETDAPYLSPEPVRRVFPNVPAHVVHTVRFLAELRGESFEALAEHTTRNAVKLFGIGTEREGTADERG